MLLIVLKFNTLFFAENFTFLSGWKDSLTQETTWYYIDKQFQIFMEGYLTNSTYSN